MEYNSLTQSERPAVTLLKPTRRDLLKLAAIAPAFALPAPALAALSGPEGAQAAFHRFSIGEIKLTVVSDGYLGLPTTGLGVNAERDEVVAFLAAHKLSVDRNYSHTNHLVIETGDAVVLVDVGSGQRFLNTAGRLMENLESAGIDPESITHVAITHAHPDHVWGIRDDFDEPILQGAEYFIGGAEYDWWMTEDRVNQVPDALQQFVVGAVNSLTTEGQEWTMAADGHEIVPGVRMISTPGHTVGHMSILIESGDNQLIALGDAMTHGYISFERPEWVGGFDQIPDQTVATRKRLLDMAATDNIAVLGYHFPFPGVGHVMVEGANYRFIPALWRWEG
jgi:glyoxylase-like metal-dependent hydrolase (beta-lactamase superfamily II)